MAKDKERLDILLVERGLVETRARARAHIMAGEVTVDGMRVDKAGTQISRTSDIKMATPIPYVSRGGYKLAGALDEFGIQVENYVAADVGACTGGFTDALLQRGASRVYAIDVGQGQLDWKLRQDDRVIVLEKTNARYLDAIDEPIDIAVIDVSFISLKLILPSVRNWLAPDGTVVALIKPQFEAGPESVGKGGIVRDPAIRQAVLTELLSWMAGSRWDILGLVRSPIQGTDGNIEYLVWVRPGENSSDIQLLIADVMSGND